jgi:hypothetical protein
MSWASQIPDAAVRRDFLPTLAYLRSARDQTLPARELALTDAVDHFDEAEASADAHWRDLALLGVIGEGMQILEDLAYIGTAYTGPDPYQLPRYVSATIYSGTVPTTFYQQLKKWSDDRLLEFGGLRVPIDGKHRSLHELVISGLSDDVIAAIRDAESATAGQLRHHLLSLAGTWDLFSKYFHAFKHGALVLGRDDFFIADEHGNEIDIEPSLSVWHRRKPEGMIHGDTNLTPRQVAQEIAGQGWLAHSIAGYLVEARLAVLLTAGFDEDGNIAEHQPGTIPWRFWVDARDLAFGTRDTLATLGVVFHQE